MEGGRILCGLSIQASDAFIDLKAPIELLHRTRKKIIKKKKVLLHRTERKGLTT